MEFLRGWNKGGYPQPMQPGKRRNNAATGKPASGNRRGVYNTQKSRQKFPIRIPTLLILSVLGFFGAITTSWLLGNSQVTELFVQLHLIQSNSPQWLMPPQLGNQYYLLIPTVFLF